MCACASSITSCQASKRNMDLHSPGTGLLPLTQGTIISSSEQKNRGGLKELREPEERSQGIPLGPPIVVDWNVLQTCMRTMISASLLRLAHAQTGFTRTLQVSIESELNYLHVHLLHDV